MEITVRISKNYGVEAIYPVDTNASIFAAMVGTKTLTRATLEYIKKLGYEIKVEQQTI